MSSGETKGLLKSLFDLQFTSLITVKIIRLLYALIVVFRMGDDVRAIRHRGDLGRRPDFPPS